MFNVKRINVFLIEMSLRLLIEEIKKATILTDLNDRQEIEKMNTFTDIVVIL